MLGVKGTYFLMRHDTSYNRTAFDFDDMKVRKTTTPWSKNVRHVRCRHQNCLSIVTRNKSTWARKHIDLCIFSPVGRPGTTALCRYTEASTTWCQTARNRLSSENECPVIPSHRYCPGEIVRFEALYSRYNPTMFESKPRGHDLWRSRCGAQARRIAVLRSRRISSKTHALQPQQQCKQFCPSTVMFAVGEFRN